MSMQKMDWQCPDVLKSTKHWSNRRLLEYFEQMSIPGHNQDHCVIQVLGERFRKLAKIKDNK